MNFQIGEKYGLKKHPGWAKLVAVIPEANPCHQLVFLFDNGNVDTRHESGTRYAPDLDDSKDVMPKESEKHDA